MAKLTSAGQKIVADHASRHALSEEAVTAMLIALVNGGGTQAQFNIHELGGMGQWSLGGMTMVGDMFNNGLKARVDTLCADLAAALQGTDVFDTPRATQSQSHGSGAGFAPLTQSSLFIPDPNQPRWPDDLGPASSVGTQNDLHYAVFPQTQRLGIFHHGKLTVYDTGTHQIHGVGQSQGGGQQVNFNSQHGLVHLGELTIVSDTAPLVNTADAGPTDTPRAVPSPEPQPGQTTALAPAPTEDDQIFARIEKLAELHGRGILTDEEFQAKKAELLARL